MQEEHRFRMRLESHYEAPGNTIAALRVELLTNDGWEPFVLNDLSPGFLIFVYAVFNCQHMYLRLNCAERDLVLALAEGSIDVVANRNWEVQKLHISFSARLKSGSPSRGDIDYIVDRMQHCPVSGNLREFPDTRTELRLD